MLKGTVIGNLGRDAELKQIGGEQYAVFSVAHSERRKDANGQLQETTTWVRCLKRDRDARLAPHLLKGRKVYVDGRISLSSYTTQQGETKYELSIWADSLEFMSQGQQADQGQQLMQQYQQAQQGQQGQTPSGWRAPGYVPPQAAQQPQGGWLNQMWEDNKDKPSGQRGGDLPFDTQDPPF